MGFGVWILLVILACINCTRSYRILAVFPLPVKSHHMMHGSVIKALVERGHHVDEISHFPLKTAAKNHKVVVNLSGTLPQFDGNLPLEEASMIRKDPLVFVTQKGGTDLCELMGLPEMQDFLKDLPNRPKYDLFVTEFFGASCYLGFGHLLKVPVAVTISPNSLPWLDWKVGTPESSAFYPSIFLEVVVPMGFLDRLRNTVDNLIHTWRFDQLTAGQTDLVRKYLAADAPDVRKLENSISLALINSYHSLNGIRPLPPGVVEVGGLHVEVNDDKLTPELKQWLDESTSGVLYFSLGSMMKVETLPKNVLQALFASFKKLAPIRVLMRSVKREELPPGLPENVHTMPWIPQLPVLAHNNTMAFITHGGLMGTQEALYQGVPLVGIPLFADQHRNIKDYMLKGMCLKMSLDITQESFDDVLTEMVVNNTKYREAALHQSKLFRDRPLSAKDATIFWLEYVVRNGANSLRSSALDLAWWQIALLDVFGFILVSSLLLLYALIATVRVVLKVLREITSKKKRGSKKTN
ncbi:UDP-glucuronosyltransferase 2A3-like [Orussus abietinus]|uniref:UDP-glucuronosyltransferase 2A3-like n=1 Tax=Orussus abietinus TaxID=222816 RepID=UPI000626C3F7|nr:UDP-glucuronosyltransferase 2A3-like [Orussus abietinus]XP_012282469.1 UDP-glucuronosyltransferase 2A3-like [Orussus abietinus]XP_012282470.1 UDP-glucuronosyltransferase 2A3-like [Orussus abietinus]XP_012282471.1 UDP-glucuronosyltransferase 2A3-like [Orussus abietinus]